MMPHNDCFIEVFYVILIYSWSNVGCLSRTTMNFPDYKDWADPILRIPKNFSYLLIRG